MQRIGTIGARFPGAVLFLLLHFGASTALAQAIPGLWGSAGCAGCHSIGFLATNPPNLSGDIPFADDSLFSDLATFKSRVGKLTSNGTMRNFANNDDVNAGGYTNLQRQEILDYLTNVRNAQVTPSVGAFPTTDVGTTSATTRQITIVNYRAEALAFTPVLNNSADFGMPPPNNWPAACGNPSSPSVGAQSSCSITISFRPTQGAAVTRTGDLKITFATATAFTPTQRTIELSGSVNPPAASFVPNAGPFTARVNVGADFNVGTLRNTGSATLALTAIQRTIGSSAISLSSADPVARPGACTSTQQLGAGATCPLWLRFNPTAQGSASARFNLTHNAAGSPTQVDVMASGTQPLIAPIAAALDFLDVQVGTNKPLTVEMRNAGNMPLTFTFDPKVPAALSGPNKDDYSVATSCASGVGATLVNGATPCVITVTFAPPLAAPVNIARTATLTVSTDADNNGGRLEVSLRGNPTLLPPPKVKVSPPTDFPATAIGDTSSETRQIVIENQRTASFVYSIADSSDFKVKKHEDCPTQEVLALGSCIVTMEFRPELGTGKGTRVANIPVSFTGTGNPSPIDAQLSGEALLPIGLQFAELRPTTTLGSSATISLKVNNNRRATAIGLTDLVLSGASAAEYSFEAASTCAKGGTLPAGMACTIVLGFKPTATGTREAKLTLTHTDLGSPQEVKLLGTGTPAPQGRLESSVAGGTLTFDDTALSGERALPVTLKNAGDAPLQFSAFELGGAQAADFARDGDCSITAPLATGATCSMTLRFRPKALGDRAAELTIRGDATNTPFLIKLAGKGTPAPAPAVRLEPATLGFGSQTLGGLYPGRTVRLTNSGSAALNVVSASIDGAAFSLKSACPPTLAAGDGCDLLVAFVPTVAEADFSATLHVASDASGSPHGVTLSGRGVAAQVPLLEWSPAVARLEFGTVSAGTLSGRQSATLANRGPGGVRLDLLNAVGSHASAFSVVGGTCTAGRTLLEGESCQADLLFAPSSAGDKTATVQVASTGSTPPTLTLHGLGLSGPDGSLGLSSTALNFEETRVGNRSLPLELTLSNAGSGAIDVTGLELTGPFVVVATTCQDAPYTLAVGASCKLTLVFAPAQPGDLRGTLALTTNGALARVQVDLSGSGEAAADLSTGGCSMVSGDSPLDPTLWTLVLLAAALLAYRYRMARRKSSASRQDAGRR